MASRITTRMRQFSGEPQNSQGSLPPLRTASAIKESESLDSWFQSVSEPSQRIQELVRRKRRRHDALLQQLRQELFREQSDTRQTVTFISTNLRAELDKASRMVKLKSQDLGEVCAAAHQGDPGALRQAVAAVCQVVQQLTEQRKRAVDAFYDLLLDVEAEHQKRAESALGKCAAALARNGHLPPHRLQPLIDVERKESGELHLHNVISFGDLRLCLTMHAERDYRRFCDSVEKSRRVCRENCQRTILTALQEAGNRSVDELISSTSAGRKCIDGFEVKLQEMRNVISLSETYPFTEDYARSWESNMTEYLKQIDSVFEEIIVNLDKSLTQLITFSRDEVLRLKEFLTNGELCTTEKLDTFYRSVCVPLLSHIEHRAIEEPTDLRVKWQQVIAISKSQIDSFATMMKDAGHLWNQHRKLQEAGRASTLQMLDKKMQDRETNFEAKERRIALVIEMSHQETSRSNLRESVERIFRILDEIKCSYETMNKSEREILEGHTAAISNELESLNSSAALFLRKHGTSEINASITINSAQICTLSEEMLKYIEQQRMRYYQDIEIFLTKSGENLIRLEGQKWISEQLEWFQKEHCELMESHQLRYNKIKFQVESTRVAELDEHRRMIDDHKKVFLEVSQIIDRALGDSFVREFQVFKDFSSSIKSLRNEGLKHELVETVRSILNQVETSYVQCKESVKSLNNEFQAIVSQEILILKTNNNNFLNSVRHFSDGGTFVDSEVSQINSEILALELNAEAYGKKKVMFLKGRSKECFAEAMKHVKICRRDLQLHVDSLVFTGKMTSLIEKVQENLKKHALALKYGGKLLKEQISEVLESCSKKDSTPNITEKWRCILETVLKRQKWLVNEHIPERENNKTAGMGFNFAEQVECGHEKTFLQLISALLKQSLREIEQAVDESLPEKTPYFWDRKNQKFLEEIREKYKLYEEQCIGVWVQELKDLLENVIQLQTHHKMLSEKVFSDTRENTFLALNIHTLKLNDNLIALRRNYQHYQVETMTRLAPTNGFPESQQVFSVVCAEFEKTSEQLCQNIKMLVDDYMVSTHQLHDNFKEELNQRKYTVKSVLEDLFDTDLQEKLTQQVQVELIHFKPFDSSHFSHIEKDVFSSQLVQAIRSLTMTVQNYRPGNAHENIIGRWTVSSLEEITECTLEQVRVLIHSKTCEVQHLYDKYKSMAEDLRTKWKGTFENIQKLHSLV